MTTTSRNVQFEEHYDLIGQVMKQHHKLIQAARLSAEDVRQDLSIRLLETLGKFDPQYGKSLKNYIRQELGFAILAMVVPSKRYGVTLAPKQASFQVVSLDAVCEGHPEDMPSHDDRPLFACILIQDEIAALPDDERAAINNLLYGERVHCDNKSLVKARRSLQKRLDEVGVTVSQEWKECTCFA